MNIFRESILETRNFKQIKVNVQKYYLLNYT